MRQTNLTIRICFFTLLIGSMATIVVADDPAQNWHRFRGPDGNGASASAQPPINWSGDSENLKWKIEVPGRASSSPIVWGDKVFIMTAVDTKKSADGKDIAPRQPQQGGRRGGRGRGRGGSSSPTSVHEFWVMCLDRSNGEMEWKKQVNAEVPHASVHSTNTFCASSPVTDGEHVYCSFGSYGLYCLDMSGEVVWKKDLGKLSMRNSFGEGSSPALFEDKLVVVTDQEGQSNVEVMDAKTGDEIWKKQRDTKSGWATPRIVEHDGKTQVVVNGQKVRSYDIADGSLIWECGELTGNPIPTPIVDGDNVICMTGWRSSACMSIPLESDGDISGSDKVNWSSRELGPYVPTGVLYKGTLYGTKTSKPFLTALDSKTGKTVIETARLSGIDQLYSSLVAANDHIYVTGRSGTTVVLKHGDALDVVATNDLGEAVDSTPALVDKEIFIRGSKHLFCFEEK
jgi:outer membrane protein assembly factor BamB